MSKLINRVGQIWIFDVGGDERQLTFLSPPQQSKMWVGVQFRHRAIMRYVKDPDRITYIDWSETEGSPFETNPSYARVA